MPLRVSSDPADLASRPDVAVIGSGIVGLASAFFASRAGLKVLLLERMQAPAALTSRRSGEGVRAQWSAARNIAISLESIALYRDFEELVGVAGHHAGYRPIGYLYASRRPDGAAALRERVAFQRSIGLSDVEYLEGTALFEHAPMLAEDAIGASFRQGDGVIDIDWVIRGYRAAMDADLLLGTEVRSIASDSGGVTLHTSRGHISAGAVIVAAGVRAAGLLSAFEDAPEMRTAQSSILRVKADGIPLDHPTTIDVDIGSFWRPDEGGARITASFSGRRFVEDGLEDPAPERGYFDHAIRTILPMTPRWREWSASLRDAHLRTGTFAVTRDGSPVIGALPSARHVYVNAGYGGHGVMMSPAGGRRLAGLLASGRPDPANPFAVERFTDGRPLEPETMTIHLTDQP
ncbi:sarcosine oxidase subunit beta [Faunimonas pinastri]|uniref:Sarcosine oxidase subunit beta n=1 Tax=Faunimonas pinastri TaxID=1855383 RepID=A0A1H9E7U6_9HYPH|nr:FAD-dependent oxidoreductase [Faunimonas pinastri]SEQ21824.1 sarcosine oxidase subunit beta [Faunimonas pinastri]